METTICACVEPQNPVVIDLLDKDDTVPDIERAIDFSLETVVRTRAEQKKSHNALWLAEKKDG